MRVYLAKAVGGTYTSVQGLRGQVDALEAELGVKLFSRTNKGLNPTVTGELFVRDVPQLVKHMARFRRDLKAAFDRGRELQVSVWPGKVIPALTASVRCSGRRNRMSGWSSCL